MNVYQRHLSTWNCFFAAWRPSSSWSLSESVGAAAAALLLLLPLGVLVDPLYVSDEVGPALGLEVAVSALVRLGQVDLPDVVAQVAEARGRVIAHRAADGLALRAAALAGAAAVHDQVLDLRVVVELDVLPLLVGRRARPAGGRGAPAAVVVANPRSQDVLGLLLRIDKKSMNPEWQFKRLLQ